MASNSQSDQENRAETVESRRKLLRTVAGGGVLGMTSLPADWSRPIVASVILPAHAQSSPGVSCCESFTSNSTVFGSGPVYVTATYITNAYPGISYGGGTLTGSFGTQLKYSVIGDCPAPCPSTGALYVGKYLSFDGNGSKYASFVYGARCGDDTVVRLSTEINSTRVTSAGGVIKYFGTGSKYFGYCENLITANAGDLSRALQGAQQRGRRRFQFGN